MELIQEYDKDATKKFSEHFSPGVIAGCFLFFAGANQSGQTGDADDLPDVTIRRDDETLMERPLGVFADWWNIRRGANLLKSTTGGSFSAVVWVPFWIEEIENAYNVGSNELEIELDPNDDGTVFSSLSVEISKIKTTWDENYLLRAMGSDQNVTSGTSNQKFDINRRNVAKVLVRDPDSVLTKVGISQNDKPVFDLQSKEKYEGKTIGLSRIEANSHPMIEFSVIDDSEEQYKKRASALNKNSKIVLSASGVGTVEVTSISLIPKRGVYLNAGRR